MKFADEKNKKYPIDTEKHIRAAWNYINKAKNAAKYDAEDLKSIKGKIIAAWKEKIDKEGPPSAEKSVGAASSRPGGETPPLQKGLYTVSYFAQMIESLTDVANSIDWEAAQEMDDSPLPGQFKEWLVSGCELLKAMAAEEVDELLADLSKTVGRESEAHPAILAKAGARHSATDQERVQQIHDHAAALGADCPGAEKAARGRFKTCPYGGSGQDPPGQGRGTGQGHRRKGGPGRRSGKAQSRAGPGQGRPQSGPQGGGYPEQDHRDRRAPERPGGDRHGPAETLFNQVKAGARGQGLGFSNP